MGNFILNCVGAFLLTITLIGLYFERKAVRVIANGVENIPFVLRLPLALILIWLALVSAKAISAQSTYLWIAHSFFFYLFTFFPHEAGHVYFWPFGNFLSVMGGTIVELALPLLLAWWAHRRELRVLQALGLYWLGFNILDMAAYIGNARAMKLEALGEVTPATHDWHIILGRLNLLDYDRHFEQAAIATGSVFVVVSVILLLQPVWNLLIPSPPADAEG